ncbi:hypothetical protein MTO96_018215 [Rhipicephalus appendiculatus]
MGWGGDSGGDWSVGNSGHSWGVVGGDGWGGDSGGHWGVSHGGNSWGMVGSDSGGDWSSVGDVPRISIAGKQPQTMN